MAKRFESIGLQLMNRASGGLPARLDRGRPRRPDQEASRRPDHRPGVPERLPADPPEQGRRREDRRPPRRPQGALRRRADRAAQLGRTEGADRRPEQGGDLADIVSEQPAPLARPEPEPSSRDHKFAVAYLALAAIVGAAVGLVVVLRKRRRARTSTKGQAWSSWSPSTDRDARRPRDRTARVERSTTCDGAALHRGRGGSDADRVRRQARCGSARSSFSSGNAGVREERIDVAFPVSGVFYQAGRDRPEPLHPRAGDAGPRPARPARSARARFRHLQLHAADRLRARRSCPHRGRVAAEPAVQPRALLPRSGFGPELQRPLTDVLPPGEAKITPSTLTSQQANGYRSADRRASLPLRLPAGRRPERAADPLPHNGLTGAAERAALAPREGAARPARPLPAAPCGSAGYGSSSGRGFSGCPGFRRFDGYAAWNTVLLRRRSTRPGTTSSRTSSATSGRCSTARSGCRSPTSAGTRPTDTRPRPGMQST